MYVQYKVNVSENQVDTLKDAVRLKKVVTLCFPKGGIRGDHVLLLTPQFNGLDKAQSSGKCIHLRLSAKQVARNVSYTGGFIYMLALIAARAIPLVAHALPTILSGLTTGLLLGGINKAISGKGVGDGLYLHKHDKCYRVQKMKGDGLYLAPHPRFVEGDGLFLKHGTNISDGAGLIMGKNSPFKNIPVLGWVL